MINTPCFSIILPTHNGEDRISMAIDSVLTQEFTDYELIVVCDACTDNTQKIVETIQDPRIRIVSVNVQRDGLARNAGLDIASGKWILFLDDDDWLLHEFVLQQLFDIIQTDSTADVVNFAVIWRHEGYRSKPLGKYLPMAAGHCWRREFVGNTRFDNASYSSDLHFLNALIEKHPVGLWSAMPLYYYNYGRPGSLSDLHKKGEI